MKKLIGDTEILLVDSAPVPDDVMDVDPHLKIILSARGGPINIDLQGASQRNIMVVNAPNNSADAVADQTMALLICEARHIARLHCAIFQRTYGEKQNIFGRFSPELTNKRLGLIGFGVIARKVAQRAKAFNMTIMAYDPFVPQHVFDEHGVQWCTLNDLLHQSDFISVHVRYTKDTHHLISEREFSLMKKTAIFVNTARGHIIDENALVKALQNKWIQGAALDVLEEEPINQHPENPLLTLPNVTLTPHSAGWSDRVPENGSRIVTQDLLRYLQDKKPINLLNQQRNRP